MGNISVNSNASIASEIKKLEEEHRELLSYDKEELCRIIKEVGFACTMCGKCCTKEFNDHVFLLTDDLFKAKEKYADAIVPAPYFEVCDQNGCFYVSGYSLRTKDNGDCIFLENNRCKIYNDRFSICRLYPYMLHRERDESGKSDWRQISGLNEHGEYNTEISDEECRKTADETIEYEKKFLIQEKDFYTELLSCFKKNKLRPVRKIYDKKMREFEAGEEITVFVFNGKSFDKTKVSKKDYPK